MKKRSTKTSDFVTDNSGIMVQHKSVHGGKKRAFGIIRRIFLAKLCKDAKPDFFVDAEWYEPDDIPYDPCTGLPRVRSVNFDGPQFEFLKNVFSDGCVLWPSFNHLTGEKEKDIFNVIRYRGDRSIFKDL